MTGQSGVLPVADGGHCRLQASPNIARVYEETEDGTDRNRRCLTAEASLCFGFPCDEGRDVVGLQESPIDRTVTELLADETLGQRDIFLARVECRSHNLNKMLFERHQPPFCRGAWQRHCYAWDLLLIPQHAGKVDQSSSGFSIIVLRGAVRARAANSLLYVAGNQILVHVRGVEVTDREPSPELLRRG